MLLKNWSLILIATCVGTAACGRPTQKDSAVSSSQMSSASPDLPETPRFLNPPVSRQDGTFDVLHGVTVADPYRWLEASVDEPEVKAWVSSQREFTESAFKNSPSRALLTARITEILERDTEFGYERKGNKLFYSQKKKGEELSTEYVKDLETGKVSVFLKETDFTTDARVRFSGSSVSSNGRYVLVTLAVGGSDLSTYRVKDLETGVVLPDAVESAFFWATWDNENKGFYYQKFTVDGGLNGKRESLGTYYHLLGTDASSDVVVVAPPAGGDYYVGPDSTETTGNFLLVYVENRTSGEQTIVFKDVSKADSPSLQVPIQAFKEPESWSFLGLRGGELFFQTSSGAPNGRIVAFPFDGAKFGALRELVPESKDVLAGSSLVGDIIALNLIQDGRNKISLVNLMNGSKEDVSLPGNGTVGSIAGDTASATIVYTFENEATERTVFERNVLTGVTKTLSTPQYADLDLGRFETRLIYFTSKDGTKVPLSIVAKKGIALDGKNPTLLYGYGGFGANMLPGFSPSRIAFLEQGGVYATAQLRGGSEYGEMWHRQGMLDKKQNVFDDFIAAGEWLISNGYTSPKHLGINGGSNGGLLVGAVLNQRPELFGAAMPEVGVMDMIRFPKFTVGSGWMSDYGNPDVAKDFATLLAYSPLHNIDANKKYPPVLVRTGARDDRVVPGHSFKYAAALQTATRGKSEVFISIVEDGSHGGATGTAAAIRSRAELFGFFLDYLR